VSMIKSDTPKSSRTDVIFFYTFSDHKKDEGML
jgi:hypothetical protein